MVYLLARQTKGGFRGHGVHLKLIISYFSGLEIVDPNKMTLSYRSSCFSSQLTCLNHSLSSCFLFICCLAHFPPSTLQLQFPPVSTHCFFTLVLSLFLFKLSLGFHLLVFYFVVVHSFVLASLPHLTVIYSYVLFNRFAPFLYLCLLASPVTAH